jgi:hypothetical protein
MTEQDNYISFLKKWFPVNKAKGLASQIFLENEFSNGFLKNHSEKFFPGCWVVSPKSHDSHRIRYAIFVHDKIMNKTNADAGVNRLLAGKTHVLGKVTQLLSSSSFGVIYAVPYTADGNLDFSRINDDEFDSISWNLFMFNGSSFDLLDAKEFFSGWRSGNKPRRPQKKQRWDDDEHLTAKLYRIPVETLGTFVLKELFYTGYLKSVMRVSTNDPYDVDGFIVSTEDKTVFPIELKEKSPVYKVYKRGGQINEHYFGIDSGRISCLERICSPNDANAFYVVREVEDGEERKLVKWKYITLSGAIMASSWNAIAGGTGMFGGGTSTIKLPYGEFADLTDDALSDENLKKISSRTRTMKMISDDYRSSLPKT